VLGRLMRRVFSKYVAAVVLLVLIVSGVFALYAYLNEPTSKDRNYNQLQKVDRSRNSFSFAAFGDNKESVKTFGHIVDLLNKSDVAFAFDDGDLVLDGDIEQYRFFLKQADRLHKPLLTAIGNHETYLNGRGNYYDLFGPFSYSFTVGRSYFIVCDDANEKGLGGFQMEWLRGELEKSRAYRNRFVFMHVPLYDPRADAQGLEHGLQDPVEAKKINDLLDRYDVTMLFTSHIHGYFTGKWGKTPYIITGGAGAELVGTNSTNYFYHYIDVRVSDSGVRYYVVKIPSPGDNYVVRLLHNLWLYIYAFLALHFFDIVLGLCGLYLVLFVLYQLEKRIERRGVEKAEEPDLES